MSEDYTTREIQASLLYAETKALRAAEFDEGFRAGAEAAANMDRLEVLVAKLLNEWLGKNGERVFQQALGRTVLGYAIRDGVRNAVIKYLTESKEPLRVAFRIESDEYDY